MAGILTQALNNLQHSLAQVGAIQNLPPQAVAIQQQLTHMFDQLMHDVPPLQTALLSEIPAIERTLSGIITQLQNGASPASLLSSIQGISQQLAQFQTRVTALTTLSKTLSAQIATSIGELSTIQGSLHSQIAGLQGQVGAAQGALDAAQKRYYYLLALGPFGLVGLAVALGLYLKWKGEVSDLHAHINALNAQIASLQAMISACQNLATSAGQVLQVLSSLKNVFDIVISDLNEIESDLAAGESATVLVLKLTAANAMLATLQSDVS